MSVKLSKSALAHLPSNVAVPSYAPGGLRAGILHFGVGNFHRAHQAVYLDDLFSCSDHDWAIVGAGVFDGEKRGRDILKGQDWLTAVDEQDDGHMQARVTAGDGRFPGAGRGRRDPRPPRGPGDPHRFADHYRGPFIDAATATSSDASDIVRDGANPGAPKTVFGLIIAGLRRRRDEGTAPFTVMCCDNIHNGHVTMNAVCGLADLSDPDFSSWIAESVAFPNGMVDRITPASSRPRARVACRRFRRRGRLAGILRTVPAMGDGGCPSGRPALEKVGVQLVDDVGRSS